MAFRSTRGRPKSAPTPKKDLGTAELRQKKRQQLTDEPLDICLTKGLISKQQHWCGLHLRWLYTVRYGAPGISIPAYHINGGLPTREEDPKWRAAREKDYKQAIAQLRNWRCYEAVMSICVYQEPPHFLHPNLPVRALNCKATHAQIYKQYVELSDGLAILEVLWEKGKKL